MRRLIASFLATALACGTLAGPRVTRAQVLDPIVYRLAPSSLFEYGCFGPCACPILMSGPMSGSFTFLRTGVDPLFTHYALLDIDWKYAVPTGGTLPPRFVRVRGHGTYDVGGEFALMQRMTLDLVTDDTLAQQFDSGWKVPTLAFPAISADVQLHVDACRDSVFHVVASPTGLADVGPAPTSRLLGVPLPNPSRGVVEARLTPSRAGRVHVEVLDVRGRAVRVLDDRDLDPGTYRLFWDGRDASGAPAGSGVYWIRARSGTDSDRRRVVLFQ